jgi:hypothetical protein
MNHLVSDYGTRIRYTVFAFGSLLACSQGNLLAPEHRAMGTAPLRAI